MAKSKIEALIAFGVSGENKVSSSVSNIEKSVVSASRAVESMKSKIDAIGVGVAFQSTVNAVHAIGGAFSAVKNVVGGAVSSVYDFVSESAKGADRIGKFSRLVGMSAEELQKFRSAGQDAGMSVESVDSALQKFSVNTGKAAAGEKSQLAIFNALGVATKNADGSVRSQMDLLLDVSDAYAKLTNSQDKNRISQELFGRSALEVSELLGGGSGSLLAQFEEFDKRGGGISNEMAKAGEEFTHAFQKANESVGGVISRMTAGLVPAFTRGADKITDFIVKNREQIDKIGQLIGDKLVSVVDDVVDALPGIVSAIVSIADKVEKIIDFTGPWMPIVSALAVTVGGALLTAVTAIAGAVMTIGPVLTGTIIPAISAAAVAAAPVVATIAGIAAAVISWGIAIKSVYDNWDMLKSFIVDDVGGAIKNVIDNICNAFRSSIDFILGGIADALQAMASLPLIGEKFAGASSFIRGFTSQKADPSGASAAKNYTSGKSSASQSRLQVDFSGMPAGVQVTPDTGFDFGAIDYSTGYAFAP